MTLLPQNIFANAALRQFVFIIGASLSALVMFQASTASAQSSAYFQAELASPVEKTTEIVRGVIWTCEGTSCVGTKDTSRPVYTCTRLVRKMGNVTAFSVRNEALGSEDLAKCNAN